MKTGITVVTYERPKLLEFVLQRIMKLTTDINLVVVSNSENEEMIRLEKLLAEKLGFTLLRNKSLMVLTARNKGTMHQINLCDYFVEMDDDVIVAPEWLGRIIDVMENDKTIGIAVPLMNFSTSLWYKDQVVNLPLETVENLKAIVNGNYDTTLIDLFWQQTFSDKRVSYTEITVPEITIQIKSKRAVEAGCLWDEGLDGACVEANSVLARQVREAGMKIVSVKNSFVYHLQTSTHGKTVNTTHFGGHFHHLNRLHIQNKYGGFEHLYDYATKERQLFKAPEDDPNIYRQHSEANLRS